MGKVYDWIDRIWQWIAETIFVRFEFDLPVEALRKHAHSDRLIFATTHGGIVEWLILSSWCRSQGLGAISVANRKRVLFFAQPKFFFQILFRRKTYTDLYLSDIGGPRILFCPSHERKKPFVPTEVENLLSEMYSVCTQAGTLARVHFVPFFILWRKHMRGSHRTLKEYFFGLSSNPNFFGKMWYLMRRRMDSSVRAIGEFTMATKENSEVSDPLEETDAMRVAKSTRRRILVLTQQEMRVALGPRYHSPHSVKETLMRDPDLRRLVDEIAAAEGVDRKKVMSRTYGILTEIVANQTHRFTEVMYVVLTWLFTRVFDGLVSREEEFQAVREVMKTKPVVFVPCHRSHLDYLVIPYVMFLNDMVPPHVAAGINLSFWPAGYFLRMGGAFFIRRSFRGDKLYSAALRKYVEYLLKNRYNLKFFIEGTRSRSGKMLPPAYGMLKMVLEANSHKVVDDIALVPVALCYDEVPEQGAYSKELGGGQKVKESAKELIKSKDIIKRNFGKVYVRLAAPLYARDIIGQAEAAELDPTLMIQKTAFQLCKSINDVTPITPKSIVSSILLGHRQPAVPLEEILRLSQMLFDYVHWSKMPLSVDDRDAFRRAIEQTVRQLQKSSVISISESVPRAFYCEHKKRIILNFYKNNAIHCLVMPSITLLCFFDTLRSHAKESTAVFLEKFNSSAISLRNVLKFEFFFSPTPVFLDEIDRNMAYFLADLDWKSKSVSEMLEGLGKHFSDWGDAALYMRLLGELIESYLVALESLKEMKDSPHEKRALAQKIVKFAEGKSQAGGIAFSESISMQNFTNSLQLFENLRFIEIKKEAEKTFVHLMPWDDRMDAVVNELSGFLNVMQDNPEVAAKTGEQWLFKPIDNQEGAEPIHLPDKLD